jgi:hypothetical protein
MRAQERLRFLFELEPALSALYDAKKEGSPGEVMDLLNRHNAAVSDGN